MPTSRPLPFFSLNEQTMLSRFRDSLSQLVGILSDSDSCKAAAKEWISNWRSIFCTKLEFGILSTINYDLHPLKINYSLRGNFVINKVEKAEYFLLNERPQLKKLILNMLCWSRFWQPQHFTISFHKSQKLTMLIPVQQTCTINELFKESSLWKYDKMLGLSKVQYYIGCFFGGVGGTETDPS